MIMQDSNGLEELQHYLLYLLLLYFPKILPLIDPEANIIVGYLQFKPGFLFFEGKEVLKWEVLSARGLVLTPLDTNLVSAIIGLYFGGSLVKK